MKEPMVSRMLRILLYIILALGIAGTVTLPFMLESYTGYFYDAYYLQPGYRMFILIFLIATAIPVLWVVLELIWMLNSINHDPFVARNARALNRIGIILLALAAMFFGKCFVYVTFLTMACGFLFIIGAMASLTLANLFRQAVAFKEENDLTI